jgi:putative spermidine/putrescine transport system permease protein
VPALVLLIVFFLVPFGDLAMQSVDSPPGGLHNYLTVLSSDSYRNAARATFVLTMAACAVCLLLGTPVAYALVLTEGSRFMRAAVTVLVLTFLSSALVRAYSWFIILGKNGPVVGAFEALGSQDTTFLFSTGAVVVGMVYYLLPTYVLMLYGGIRNIAPELIQAAESLGARHGVALRTVYLPLAMPAIANAFSVSFVISVGFFIVPSLLGGPSQTMLSQLIADAVQKQGDFGLGAAAGLTLLTLSLAFLGLVRLALVGTTGRRR